MKPTQIIVAGVAGLALAGCGTIFEEDLNRVTADVQELKKGNDPFEGRGQVATASQSQPAAGQPQAAAGSSSQRTEVVPPLNEQLLRNVQKELKAEGINPGPIDGIWGPKTSRGVREFQKAHGLEDSGQLNGKTLSALGIGDGRTAAAGAGARAQ